MATNGDSVFQQNALSRLSVQAGTEVDDYWAEDFDSGKNCEQEEKMIKLLSEVGAHSHW